MLNRFVDLSVLVSLIAAILSVLATVLTLRTSVRLQRLTSKEGKLPKTTEAEPDEPVPDVSPDEVDVG